MTLTALGRVNVPTPGTPVPLSTNPALRACRVSFQAVPGLAGKGYIGTPQMQASNWIGVTRVIAPTPAAGVENAYEIVAADGTDSIELAQLAIDMDIAGEGILISYWVE